MTDKFAKYYENNPKRIEELSEYVHQNHKIIMTKMLSEMRRKLDITPNLTNSDGYTSLMFTLQGRMFNEIIYSLAGMCQSSGMKLYEIVPLFTLDILLALIKGDNPLNGKIRTDVIGDKEQFEKMYDEIIDELRSVKEALPK